RKGGFGMKLVQLLVREDVKATSHVHQDDKDIVVGVPEPDILVLSYDLRHPLFAPSPSSPPAELEYVPPPKTLAKKLDPSSGRLYLMTLACTISQLRESPFLVSHILYVSNYCI
ncbi:hypothetical protein FIBSPDRAFT_873475, partial [Athelia psychrophila]